MRTRLAILALLALVAGAAAAAFVYRYQQAHLHSASDHGSDDFDALVLI